MNIWYEEAFFYHIYPLGLCGAEPENPALSEGEGPITHRLPEITEWLPYLVALGINALYIGPLFESESHGYDTLDYYKVDRRLGNNQDLQNLVEKCHNSGIRVILDGVFNHVSRHFFAFKDILEKREDSQYRDWIKELNFSKNNSYADGLSYQAWNGNENLVTLNLENHDTREHLFGAVRFWIETFNIDGIRLDAADCLDDKFLEDFSLVCNHKKEDFFLLGEIIHGDYAHWANSQMLHSVTNYEVWKGLWSSIKDRNMFEIAWTLKREFGDEGLYKGLPLYNFTDNHDVDRVIEQLDKPSLLYPLYLLMFCIPGIPSIYYGSEFGVGGTKNGPDDSGMRPRLRIEELNRNAEHPDLL
ncbi:MAG: alpha-amylase family glycosyl hydrolase [Spirochaetia bacterium]|jgi:cyclomaltodextrinase|nr:alpha-amylase family glycosyl hydrolase [Spirochaetia bacterium]